MRVISAMALAATAGLAAHVSHTWAQEWPTKAISLVVPFPAGGGTDAFARPLSAILSKQLGKQIVNDNRGGAGGNLGAGIASRAPKDGYTYFMGAVHHAIAMDPLTGALLTLPQIRSMVDEMFAAEAQWLPQFA